MADRIVCRQWNDQREPKQRKYNKKPMATFLVLCLRHLSDDYFTVEFVSCQFWGNVYCFVGILREYDVYVKPKTGVDF